MKVPSEILRIYKSLHTWTGIIGGLGLFIAFYAGALTVFKEPVRVWLLEAAPVRSVPLKEAGRLIEGVLASRPSVAKDFTLHLDEAGSGTASIRWAERQADDDESAGHPFSATLAADGSVRVQPVQGDGLADFIDTLHRVIGLPVDHDYARWLMGVVAVLYALALVSGTIVLLPSLVRDFFLFRAGKNTKRMWLDAHNIVGIISLPFHLVMALTAVVFAYHDLFYQLQERISGVPVRMVSAQAAREMRPPARLLPPGQLMAKAHAVAPALVIDALQYQDVAESRARVRVWGHDSRAVMPRPRGGFLVLDPYSGKVLGTDMLPGAQRAASAVISSFFALHMASFGGAVLKWIYFLLSMAGAWLFYSGNLLWIESRRVKASRTGETTPEQRRDVRFMAALSVGVSLGCMTGISLSLAASKLLNLFQTGQDLYLPLYYAVFLSALAWAFFRGAAVAARDLLRASVLATLAIPISSLLVALVNGHDGPGWPVDATALVAAVLLHQLAKRGTRRLDNSPPDSVWQRAPNSKPARTRAETSA